MNKDIIFLIYLKQNIDNIYNLLYNIVIERNIIWRCIYMRLSEVKNSENKVTLNCQLLITEEKTQKNDNYLKLEFSDRTKLYINIFNSNKKYEG